MSSGLGGLNKSPNGVVLGMVQLQLPVVKTIEDLADFKYCQWAEAIVVASKFENVKKQS